MKVPPRRRRLKQVLLAVALAAGFLPPATGLGQVRGNETRVSQKPAAAVSAPIPVAEIAAHAAEVTNSLRTMEAQFAPSPAVATIQKLLPKVGGHIDLLSQATTEILQEQAPLATIQTQQQIWEGMQTQTNGWLKVLTERAVQLRDALNRLGTLQETWRKSGEAAQTSQAPATTIQQINAALAAITATQALLEAERSRVLDLQGRVSQELARCGSILAQIAQAQKEAMGGILLRDGLPLWSAELWTRAQTNLGSKVGSIAAGCWEDLRQYATNPSLGMPLHVVLLLLFMLVFCAGRRRRERWTAAGERVPATAEVFDHPYAAALFGVLFVATSPFSPTPQTVQDLCRIAALVPMIRLIRAMVDPGMVPGLSGFAILFAVDIVRQTLEGVPLVGQVLLELETLAGVLMLAWSLAFGRLRPSRVPVTWVKWLPKLQIGAGFVMLTFTAALIAGALGYLRMARLLPSEILAAAAMALAVYAFLLVVGGVVVFALRTWPLRLLAMVQQHRDLLDQRAYRILIWLGVAGWLLRWLAYTGVLQPVLSLGEEILAMNLERGAINVSLGDVLAFFLTVWVAYLLSVFVRFTLKEELYPRIGVAPGLSYAISSLLHYLILALGVVVGMGLMGVNLAQVTIMAGAFGVGIGFGLQSVVNNFVCGLILLFERPIHVGDMVEVGDLLGEVRRIGIRASTLRTRQGADMIVPNAQLVTEKVTNWTLGDKLRRIQLPVGVNYGASPERVIKLLEAVARTTPRLLQDPPPRALFMSYGDSSINFELRAWTDEYLNWRRVRSDLAVAVYDAVIKAGISFPFPQREVRLLQGPGSSGKAE